MAKEVSADLQKFLITFPALVQEITLWLRAWVWDAYPESTELIYDNYNALAIGFATSDRAGDVFCSLAVYSKHVNFGFNRGSEITDPDHLLNGKGSLYRHITVKDLDSFPAAYLSERMAEAYANSLAKRKARGNPHSGQTITKSISAVQRRPGK